MACSTREFAMAEAATSAVAAPLSPVAGFWGDAWRRLRAHRAAFVSVAVLAAIVLLALVGPLVGRYSIEQVDWSLSPLASPPSLANGHWFGTDANGRDLFVRVWHGTRVSLLVALLATTVSIVIGVVWGAI